MTQVSVLKMGHLTMIVVLFHRLNHAQTITLMLRALNAQPKLMEMYGIPIPVFVMIVVANKIITTKTITTNKTIINSNKVAVEPLPS